MCRSSCAVRGAELGLRFFVTARSDNDPQRLLRSHFTNRSFPYIQATPAPRISQPSPPSNRLTHRSTNYPRHGLALSPLRIPQPRPQQCFNRRRVQYQRRSVPKYLPPAALQSQGVQALCAGHCEPEAGGSGIEAGQRDEEERERAGEMCGDVSREREYLTQGPLL